MEGSPRPDGWTMSMVSWGVWHVSQTFGCKDGARLTQVWRKEGHRATTSGFQRESLHRSGRGHVGKPAVVQVVQGLTQGMTQGMYVVEP